MRVEVSRIPQEFDRYATPADLLEACQDKPLSGYPQPEDRWHISADEWDTMAATGVITIPEGPWAVLDHPTRARDIARGVSVDPADPDEIDPAKKAAWRTEYSLVTDRGLPVHPMAQLGVTTEVWNEKLEKLCRLGMATGIGRERRYGALETGALLLARSSREGEIEYPVVTELRGGKLRRSFPGGYVELGESIADACVRESNEESSVVEACELAGISWSAVEALPHVLWKLSPAVTGPCTINAWLAEHFLAIDATAVADMQAVALQAGALDNIEDASWRPACELITDPLFLGAHRRALRAHISMLHTR